MRLRRSFSTSLANVIPQPSVLVIDTHLLLAAIKLIDPVSKKWLSPVPRKAGRLSISLVKATLNGNATPRWKNGGRLGYGRWG